MFLSPKSLIPAKHIRESAWLEHAPFVFWLMEALRPRTVVELGTHHGFSFLTFCQSAKTMGIESKIYAVDTWQGDEHAGFYSSEVFNTLEEELRTQYPGIGVMIKSTFNEARPQFSDGSIDLLHIDGRHRFEDVLEDFDSWKSALSDKGVVLFHDTRVQRDGFGVWKFWNEIERSYPSFEFFHGNGLGVLVLGKNTPSILLDLCNASFDEKSITREIYSRLGSINSTDFALNSAVSKHQRIVSEMSDKTLIAETQSKELRTQLEANIAQYNRITNELCEKITFEETKNKELLAQLENSITAQNQTANELLHQRTSNTAILASRSWRLTAPYRYIGRSMKYVMQTPYALHMLVKRNNGIRGTSIKALSILKREGISGLSRRLIHVSTMDNNLRIHQDGTVVDKNDYTHWLQLYRSMDKKYLHKIKNNIDSMDQKPTISIIMPIYNPNIEWLREAIDSIRNQIYTNWELCIADDCSTNIDVKREIKKLQKEDNRIRVVFRSMNGHISAASNSAIELATGDWMALMDQDDLLPEDALYHVAQSIHDNPNAGLIYSDEDKIDETGKRFDPYFKSDWNPDLFLSHNMVSHLGVYRTELVKTVGGFREGLEGSQDYDLALRISEILTPDQIVHISRVLYHWRSHSDSTAQAGSNKNYALTAGKRALDEHFQRTGIQAEAELLEFGMYRARYGLPDELPMVSLIIPTRNGLALLKQCIESILEKTTYENYEIIVVDNNSDDPEVLAYFEDIQKNSQVSIIHDKRPFNYSALNNNAVKYARGEYIGLINNDIEVISPDWLTEMVSLAIQPNTGAIGACLWYPNDTLQHGGVVIGMGGVAEHAHKNLPRTELGYFGRGRLIQSMSAVTAACLVVSKNIYNQVGGLDEQNLTIAFNDIDFCLKVREAGYRNIWTPYAELYHHESASRGHEDTPEKQKRFQAEIDYMIKTWATDSWNDPAYSPNLTLAKTDFSLAWPPRVNPI